MCCSSAVHLSSSRRHLSQSTSYRRDTRRSDVLSLSKVQTSNMIPSQAPLDHSRSENHTQISEGAVTLSNIETAHTRVLRSKFSPSRLATHVLLYSMPVSEVLFYPSRFRGDHRLLAYCTRAPPDSNRDSSRIQTDFFSWPPPAGNIAHLQDLYFVESVDPGLPALPAARISGTHRSRRGWG